MRPGVAGFLPGDIAAIDEDTAKCVQEADFTGAHITFSDLFNVVSQDLIRAKTILADQGHLGNTKQRTVSLLGQQRRCSAC